MTPEAQTVTPEAASCNLLKCTICFLFSFWLGASLVQGNYNTPLLKGEEKPWLSFWKHNNFINVTGFESYSPRLQVGFFGFCLILHPFHEVYFMMHIHKQFLSYRKVNNWCLWLCGFLTCEVFLKTLGLKIFQV